MASHHHHRHHPPAAAACCCSTPSYSSCHCTQSHPPPQQLDPLLLHILQTPQYPKYPSHSQHQSEQTQLLLHSLLSRIESLEASIHSSTRSRSRPSSSSSSSSLRDYAARVIQTHFRAHLVRRSRTLRQLKDLASIRSSFSNLKSSVSNRTHFDFTSVSRKALSLLIKLDSIQSGDAFVRDGRRTLSRDLVRFMEVIEGVVAKRQGGSLRPVKNARPNVGNVRNEGRSRGLGGKCRGLGKDEREMIGKLKERIEKIRGFAKVAENDEEDVELEGFEHVSDDEEEEEEEESGGRYESEAAAAAKRGVFEPKVKRKSVNFAEDENVFRVFSNSDEAASSGNGSDSTHSSDDHGEQVENCNEVEYARGFAMLSVDGDDALLETGGSPKTSDAQRTPRGQMTQRKSHDERRNEHPLFSAPLPVKMDPKENVVKRIKGVKILT